MPIFGLNCSMRHYWTKVIAPLTLAATLLAILSCSSQKNTAKSRFWQSFTAKYNTYYNGTLAYIDGSLEKENGNKDNYTEMIPLYPVANKQSREIGKGNYERLSRNARRPSNCTASTNARSGPRTVARLPATLSGSTAASTTQCSGKPGC